MFVLSFVPFSSPFVMLSRIMVGPGRAVGDRAVGGDPRRLERRDPRPGRPGSTRPASILYGQRPGRPGLPARRALGGRLARASRRAPVSRRVERQALDQGEDRDRPRRRRPASASAGPPTARAAASVPGGRRDEPPQPAADAGQVRAAPVSADDPGDAARRGRGVERATLAGDRRARPAPSRRARPSLGVARAAARAARRGAAARRAPRCRRRG